MFGIPKLMENVYRGKLYCIELGTLFVVSKIIFLLVESFESFLRLSFSLYQILLPHTTNNFSKIWFNFPDPDAF